ncbi:hypothetical protein HBF26_00315 [Luteibacter jiangsuensis]|uniref:Uncharacterized protein n=1 Tax=Luteibacter jiangsuensis TaxID=637577 RepID=A0ABX0PXZ1_9GAMM|nr:hypothetical protein [Luteibacter jiangsuensis]NID03310.1 hypothetical protein [Luteibacter jiangsuensis]
MRFLEYLVHQTRGVVMTPGEPASLVLDLELFGGWIRTSKAEVGDAAWEAVHGLLMELQKQAGGPVERLAVAPWDERANFPDTNALLTRAADTVRASSWRKDRQLLAGGFDDGVVRARFIALSAAASALQPNRRNPFPFIVLHSLASSHTTEFGFTLKFQTDHMSQNKNSERRAAKVADRRFQPAAPGRAPIPRSTTIDQGDEQRFFEEVRSRKQEFTDTYRGLSDWYVRLLAAKPRYRTTRRGAPVQPLIDGVTFVTRQEYTLHEYQRVGTSKQGAERKDRVQFSLAPTEDGKDWAVHHLNGSGMDMGPEYKKLADMGLTEAGIDGLTCCLPAFPTEVLT